MIAPLLLAAAAPASPPLADDNEIVVLGSSGKGYRLTPAQLREVARAFLAGRGTYAPAARLVWRMRPTTVDARLALHCGERVTPVDPDTDGYFVLPENALLTGTCRLTSRIGRGGLRIQPLARSPGSTLTNYRFGDAHLSCRIEVAMALQEAGIFARSVFAAAGGCTGKRLGIYVNADRPVASVSISHWGGKVELTRNGTGYRVPLYDRTIGYDERLTVTFR